VRYSGVKVSDCVGSVVCLCVSVCRLRLKQFDSTCVGQKNPLWDGVHIGTTWRIRLIEVCGVQRCGGEWLWAVCGLCNPPRLWSSQSTLLLSSQLSHWRHHRSCIIVALYLVSATEIGHRHIAAAAATTLSVWWLFFHFSIRSPVFKTSLRQP